MGIGIFSVLFLCIVCSLEISEVEREREREKLKGRKRKWGKCVC